MPHTGSPVRLADFTVRLFLPADLLGDEGRIMGTAYSSLHIVRCPGIRLLPKAKRRRWPLPRTRVDETMAPGSPSPR
jgi:hypothetical protein